MSEPATILVTGGAGYIGSHTCKALKAAGYQPITYDNLSTGHRHAVQWGPLEMGDVRDEERLYAVIEKHQPAAIIHFAALAYIGESEQFPIDYYKTNVVGTLSLLSAMKRAGLRKIVFSSSCATYGIPSILPIGETQPQNPINAYGRTKLIVEHMLEDFRRIHGFQYTILRYFNAAGADLEGEIGEDHSPETHLIPNVILAACDGPELTVHGTDHDTPDGTCIRDYVHVCDLAEAHVRALETILPEEAASLSYNLGSGTGVSIFEIMSVTSQLLGRPVKHLVGPKRVGDPPCLVADTKRARQMLGWQPRNSDLTTIINSAYTWFQKKAALSP